MPEELFDISHEYDKMLQRGISLSGEDKEFFVRGRVAEMRSRLPVKFPVLLPRSACLCWIIFCLKSCMLVCKPCW